MPMLTDPHCCLLLLSALHFSADISGNSITAAAEPVSQTDERWCYIDRPVDHRNLARWSSSRHWRWPEHCGRWKRTNGYERCMDWSHDE